MITRRWSVRVLAMLLLGASPGAAQAPGDPPRLTLEAGVGPERASLRWNTGPGSNPERIASELTYSRIAIRVAALRGTLRVWSDGGRDLLLTADGRFGSIVNGRARDSDYSGAHRDDERYRALADLTGDFSHSMAAAMGVRLRLTGDEPVTAVTGWLGIRQQRQALRMQDGSQIIPAERSIQGLDSRYTTQWAGSFMALEPGFARGPVRVEARFTMHVGVGYHAEGEWNLRDDLAQPVSFDHTGDGHGLEARVRASVTIPAGAHLAVQAYYSRLRLEDGVDKVYFVEKPRFPGGAATAPRTVTMNLHEVVSEAIGAQVMVSIDF